MNAVASRIAALSPEKRALLARQLQRTDSADERPPLVSQPRTTRLFPLSFAQERQWFLHHWDPESTLYTIAYGVRFTGKLDVALLQRAVDLVVQRHEILRTTFTTIDGLPYQVIADHAPIAITHVDLSDRPPEARERAVAELATGAARRPFDLGAGPLLRMMLIHLQAQEHVQVLTVQHIIFDGWSAGVMIREIGALVEALSGQQAAALPRLSVQYADVAVWQRAWLQGQAIEQRLAYWKQQLAGNLPILTLPTDRPYPPVESPNGARCKRNLPRALAAALEQFSREQGATLFMTLLAAWKTLLYRYTRQDDLLVGTPVAGRPLAQTEPLIGYFANTLVLRTRLADDPTYLDLLQRVRATTSAAYDNQDVPFEKVVEALQIERDLSHSPLFQVMFVLQNDAVKTLATADLTVEPIAIETGTAKFALTLEATQLDRDLVLALEYKTDLFDAPTIERMLEHYQTLLASILARPQLPISRLALLSEQQRQALIDSWHQVQADAGRAQCLQDMFAAQAASTPDAIAVTYEDTGITYGALNARANQVAHQLRTLGIGPEALVGLCVEPSIEMLIGILAILKAGGAYVPLDPATPHDRIAFVLEDACIAVLLTQQRLVDRLPRHSTQLVCLDSDWTLIGRQPASNPSTTTTHANRAYVIYTSGSTGQPKGVQVAHGNVSRLFSATDAWFSFSPRDVWTLFHSAAFDFSVWELWGALLYGGRLVVVPYVTTRSPEAFHQLLCDEGVTVLNQTPSAFRQLMRADEEAPAARELALRYVIFGGEALNIRSLRPWFDRHGDSSPRLINMYGITETTVHVTYRPLTYADACDAPGSMIGRPIPDLQLYILDQHCEPVPLGVAGELYVGGAGVARGYLNRDSLTVERFIVHPFSTRNGEHDMVNNDTPPPALDAPHTTRPERLYKTGDLARLLPNGDIEYLGRLDKQVKIRGFRIELGEIEAAISQHPAVREVVVMAREDTPGDQRLVAYLVVHEGQTPTFGQLRSSLKRKLPEHMIPAAFITLDAIPLTHNGKVDYQALPARTAGKQLAAPRPTVAASRPLEQIVAGIWAGLLGIQQVGLHDNFFELGGHSLLATQVMTRLREAFGIELSLRDFFAAPTVSGLVANIETARAATPAAPLPPIVPLGRTGALPLSFAQQRIWFLNQMQPDSAFYNVPAVFQFQGSFRVDILERSLSEIVRRHEALRTTFTTGADSAAVQYVNAPQPLQLPLTDLSDHPEPERAATMWRMAMEAIQRPFDLAHDLLLRGIVLRLSPTDHLLVLTIHHIAFDEWSCGVLIQELATLYRAFASDQPTPLIDLPIQYPDFAAWQREWLQGSLLDAQIDYWKQQLGGELPMLDMPTDFPRPAVQSSNGAHAILSIPPTLYTALNDLARQEEATLFMVLMAAWSALLQRYTNQDDILVGTPIANRNRSEIESLIGFFANTLVIRNNLSERPSFRDALRRTRETMLEAYAHQDVPFDQLVNVLQPDRYLSRSPLFQTMLVLQNAVNKPFTLPDLTISSLPVESATAKFELSLVLYDQDGALNGWLEYNTDLFSQATILWMLRHFQSLLERAVADPDQPLAHISLVTADEQHQLLMEWNEPTADAYVLD